MPLGDRSWRDSTENYVDAYTIRVNGTTATGVSGTDLAQPHVVYSVTLAVSQAGSTGDFALVDGSATGDSGDARIFRTRVASGTSGERTQHFAFPRGLVCDTGLIVSATTITGDVTIGYKRRYA